LLLKLAKNFENENRESNKKEEIDKNFNSISNFFDSYDDFLLNDNNLNEMFFL
jgi:hypothetical protein